MTNDELNPCAFCGGVDIDAAGWTTAAGKAAPACCGCGLVAPDVETWNSRGWQPIETAPMEGTEVLGYLFYGAEEDDKHFMDVISFSCDMKSWVDSRGDLLPGEPSHWHPLPAPPAEGKK